jgi:hypothetical protein
MKITRENYEAYMIDLIEGNLSAVQEQELKTFLLENPDLSVDPDIYLIKLPVEDVIFSKKEDIKKGGNGSEINEGNYGQFCIAGMEKDLSPQMEKSLEQFLIENPHLHYSASVYKRLVLRPDRTVVFNDKQLLAKRRQRSILSFGKRELYRAFAVAASIALIVSSYLFIHDYTVPGQIYNAPSVQQIAGNEQISGESDLPGNVTDRTRDAEINEYLSNNIASNEYNHSIQVLIERKIEKDHQLRYLRREPVLLPLLNRSHSLINIEVRSDISAEPVKPLQNLIQPGKKYIENNEDKKTGRIILNGLIALVNRDIDAEAGNERERLKIWDIADAGFKAINTLAGTDLYLGRDYDENREVISLGLPSRVIEFQRSLPDED